MKLSLCNFCFRFSSLVRARFFHCGQSSSCFLKISPCFREWWNIYFMPPAHIPVPVCHYHLPVRLKSSNQKYTNEDGLFHVDDLFDEDELTDGDDDDGDAPQQKEKLVFPQNKEHSGYKDISFHCSMPHAFDVAQCAFHMTEEEVDSFLYDGRLRVNKERVGKRNAKVKAGDLIDLIKEVTDTDVTMKRVEVLHLEIKERVKKGTSKQKRKSTPKQRYLVVRRWKHLKVKRIQ